MFRTGKHGKVYNTDKRGSGEIHQKTGGIGQGRGQGFQTWQLRSKSDTNKLVDKATQEYLNHKANGDKVTASELAEKYDVRLDDITDHARFLYSKSYQNTDGSYRDDYQRPRQINSQDAHKIIEKLGLERTYNWNEEKPKRKPFSIIDDLKSNEASAKYLESIAQGNPISQQDLANQYGIPLSKIQEKIKIMRENNGL